MKIFKYLALLPIALLMQSCGGGGDDAKPESKEFELYIDYWNPQGTNPQISFDGVNSSPEIKIDFTKTFAGVAVPPIYTNVIIDNVRIIDDNNINYEIGQITAYEWRDDIDDWKVDVEFTMNFTQVQDLAVMMVLDESASLGQDFEKVKNYAASFISKVLEQVPNARIGIVDFADQLHTFPPTNNKTALLNYIASLTQGPFTTLYEATNMGITMLEEIDAESKTLLIFTDGTDNNSDPEFTPDYLLERLNNSTSDIKITSFAIGLEGNGGVDKPVLTELAANGGSASFPKNIDELGRVFEKYSSTIANVYNLTYVRNQQVVPDTDKRKLRFVIKGTAKQD
jgi:hypothetical protein